LQKAQRVGHPGWLCLITGGYPQQVGALDHYFGAKHAPPAESRGFSDKTKDSARTEAQGKCQYCGQETTKGEKSEKGVKPPGSEGQTDHYEPKSKGGSNEKSNAVHSCRECNLNKSKTSPKGTKWELPKKKSEEK